MKSPLEKIPTMIKSYRYPLEEERKSKNIYSENKKKLKTETETGYTNQSHSVNYSSQLFLYTAISYLLRRFLLKE